MTRTLLSCRRWFLANHLARSGIWGSVCVLCLTLLAWYLKITQNSQQSSKQRYFSKERERKLVTEQHFCLQCLHLCSNVRNKSAQWMKSSYLWNSNKKDSLCEHVIFEWIMIQSPGFSEMGTTFLRSDSDNGDKAWNGDNLKVGTICCSTRFLG